MELDGDKSCKGLHTTRRAGAECTSDPESSIMLHLSEGLESTLILGTIKIPKTKTICRDKHNACLI